MKDQKKIVIGLGLLAILTFAAYSFAVNGSYKTMDDDYSIVRNEKIRSFKNLPAVMTSAFFGDESYYRPLVTVSFMKEYFFFKLNPVPYYVDNIIIHIFNAFLVFGITLALTGRRRVAMGTAFLFALHPIQWEAVSNIPGRSILLCAFYGLSTFYCFILGEGQSGRRKYFSYLSILCFAFALLSKESAGIIPLVIVSYIYFIKSKGKLNINKLIYTMFPYALVTGLYLFLRSILGITKTFPWRSLNDTILGFITFLQSLIIDFGLLLFPVDLYFDRSQPILTSYFSAGAVSTVIFFAVMLSLLWMKRHQISGLTAFCISWFFIEMLPVSQLITTVGVQPGYISTAEHFLYISSVSFFILAALAFSHYQKVSIEQRNVSKLVFRFVMGGFFMFLILMTIQYNIYSSNETAMFERTLQLNPTNNRIRTSLALSYAKKRRYDLAEVHFRKAVFNEPFNARARIGLAKSLFDQGKFWEALREYELVSDPGGLKQLLDDNIKSTLLYIISHYERMLRDKPDNPRAYHSLGVLYSKLGEPKKAVEFYEKALTYDPNLKESIFNLASTYEMLGDREKAITYYQRVLSLKAGPDELDRIATTHLGNMARGAPVGEQAPQP